VFSYWREDLAWTLVEMSLDKYVNIGEHLNSVSSKLIQTAWVEHWRLSI